MSTKKEYEVAREIDNLDEAIMKIDAKRVDLKLKRAALKEEKAGLKAKRKELRQKLKNPDRPKGKRSRETHSASQAESNGLK